MHYNLTNLAILFFCYSFLGWGIETSVASVKSTNVTVIVDFYPVLFV